MTEPENSPSTPATTPPPKLNRALEGLSIARYGHLLQADPTDTDADAE